MKSKILALIAFSVILYSCNKNFLDKYPLDSINDGNYWNTEQDLQLYNNSLYPNYIVGFGYSFGDATVAPYGYTQAAIAYGDVITDNAAPNSYSLVAANKYIAYLTGLSGSGGWSFSNIRSINLFLENFRRTKIPTATQNVYGGEVYFFKAWDYFEKVKLFGDVPWLTTTLTTTSPELYAARTPRAVVMDSVLNIIDTAIAWLPSKGKEQTDRLNKDQALFLKMRIGLYEGTYRKYHTELNLDGKKFLQAAANACEQLMGGTYSVVKKGDASQVYNSLFAQYTYKGNAEVILSKEYSESLQLGVAFSRYFAQNLRHQFGATRNFMDEYLCADGLPISSSPLFLGKDSIQRELQNRDPRLSQTVCNFGTYCLAVGVSQGANNAPKPNIPGLTGNKCPTGYRLAKWFLNDPVDWNRVTNGMQAAPVFRYAEVLLDYAEAKFELGECDQAVVDKTINAIRDRVGMPHLLVTTIPADPILDGNYATYCAYTPVPLLREIRRERRVEMAFENTRWDDLMRWKAGRFLEIPVEGMKFVQSQFPTVKINSDVYLSNGGYLLPYAKTLPTGRVFDEKKQYLFPIPVEDVTLNPALKQNPGW
ncbi:RagB/SusD family nutrient uptake outer membrane protein [Chitinophagaceae bacterium 26-R-25]|nr:RagB/SusD family nutrient uptake outer membrane protein [Chitinophagaceae bacterium 26-R-25]